MFVLIMMLMGCATAKVRPWDKWDKTLAVTSCVAMAFDIGTTMRGLDRGGYEKGPPKFLIGEHPSDTDLVLYAISSQALALTVAHFFPKLRKYILGGKTSLNTFYAIRNHHTTQEHLRLSR